jgi:isoamylase
MCFSPAPRPGLRRQPAATINFITCHDGFTLNDLVSYDVKHNDANQQGNSDGTDDNRSWNCGNGPGDDGPSPDADINTLRRRRQRNLLTTLLVSRGVPMLMAGDERNRTQQGNNNAYCQDNQMSWIDWTDSTAADTLTTVVRKLLALRGRADVLRAPRFPDAAAGDPSEPVAETGMRWFNPNGTATTSQDWNNPDGHSFAALFAAAPPALSVLVLFNAYWDPVQFARPAAPGGSWTAELDTGQEDGSPPAGRPGGAITVGARAVVIATS